MPFSQVQAGLLFVLAVYLAGAIYWDIRSRRIPNKLVLSGLLTALAFHAMVSGLPGLLSAFVGAVTGLLVLLPLNVMRLMGAGDVKLMAMAGAFGAGFQTVLWMGLYTLLAGSLLVVVYATMGHAWGSLFSNLFAMLKHGPAKLDAEGSGNPDKLQPAARLPYSVAIACGSMGYLLFGLL